ncbi:MAG: glycyl-radical enzyme activating protein [Erysipelotrichaceae bacterium]|nr:glycyl-radical enzyme activating protein [Erysipelotrichaceae bacterium]
MEKSKDALVFSIKRFALHDGNGLRTTIFLKGCNLSCVWCHNPEGIELERKIQLSKKKCINCNRCVEIDTDNVIVQKEKYKEIINKIDVDYKKYIDVCPSGAIDYDSKYYTSEELLEIVLKDKVFFKHGGGVTLSGGEALLQLDFVIDFLKKCNENNINTALETALNISTDKLKKVLPYVNTLYCDLKEIDLDKHYRFTGVKNKLILKNIEYLLTSKFAENIIIRTPLIPNHTATKENISKISRYISDIYPQVKYELLNYNPLGISKYIDLGKKYPLKDNIPMFSKIEMEEFKDIARLNGITNLI